MAQEPDQEAGQGPAQQPTQQAAQQPMQARVYQLELLELAKNRNVIAFLDTGSGKTFISVLLIRHCVSLVKQNAEDKRVAVFLAPKVALVIQQSEVLRVHTPYKVGTYVGEMGVDLWERKRWRREWEEHDIMVMTPQILLNLLQHAIVKLSQVHLLVLDECHHAHGGHPYNRIMQQFYHGAPATGPRPHIFGMTASPANIRPNQRQQHMEANIRALEANLHSKVVTVVNRDAVERVAPPPTLRVLQYMPGRWDAGDASGATDSKGTEVLGPLATFMARLSRARRRLQCASDYFEIRWQQGLQQQLGMEGVTGERVFFDPSIPGTTASKLDSMLGSVQHVVESMGPWCGAVCFQELLRSLLSANSQPWYYLQQQQQREQQGGSRPRPPRPKSEACLQEALSSDKMQALVSQVLEAGFDVAEVEREQDAANVSAAEVLAAFGELLLRLPGAQRGVGHEAEEGGEGQWEGGSAPSQEGRAGQGAGEHVSSPGKRKEGDEQGSGPHPSKRSREEDGSPRAAGAQQESPSGRSKRLQQFQSLLEQVQEKVRSRQLLQDLPVRAMRLVLGAISPQQLEEAVLGQGIPGEEAVVIPTPSAAMPSSANIPPAASVAAERAEGAMQGQGQQGQGSPSEDEVMPPIQLLQLTPSSAGEARPPSTSLRPTASPAAPSLPGSGGGSILSMLFNRTHTPTAAVPSAGAATPVAPAAVSTPAAVGVPGAWPAAGPAGARAPPAARPAVAENGRVDMEWQKLLQLLQQQQAQQKAQQKAQPQQDVAVPLVTPKLRALVRQLLLYKDVAQGGSSPAGAQEAGAPGGSKGPGPAPAPWSAIVFVTQRMAAWGLHSALRALPCLSFLRTSAIMGAGARVGEGGYGVKEQSRILKRFRSGDLNLLVSTAVAEEGIDVKSCQLVLRFDLPNTAQSYIQSRGRARMHNSELVMMVQRGVAADMQMVRHMVSYEQQLRQEVLLNIERLQAGQLSDDDEQDEGEDMGDAPGRELYYEVPSTGARITLGNAQLVLNNYITELPADRYVALRPLFRTQQLGPLRYRSRVFLPNNAPLPTADGMEQAGRKLAIAAAALEACRKLHELGALDDHLLPAMAEEPTRPQQQQHKRKAVGTDEVLENKAHEPPVPVIIQTERPPLMKGKLGSLLGQGPVPLYAYRWVSQVQDPHAPGRPSNPGGSAPLLGLESLAVLLMGPLPQGLPPCCVHITDPGEKKGYRVEQVGLAPAAQLVLSQEQLASLLACHGVLLRHMSSKGAYCGASAAAAAARWQRRAAERQLDSSNIAQGRAGAGGEAASQARPGAAETAGPAVGGQNSNAASAAAIPAVAAAQVLPALDGGQQAQTMPVEPPAPAAGGQPCLVRQLVLEMFNRVVLLHDGVPLLPRREEVAMPKPEDTSFLLAPCRPGVTGDGCIDWAGLTSMVQGDAYPGSALGLLQSGGWEAVAGRVVVTEYNKVPYVARGLAQDATLSSRFPAAQPAWRSRRVRTPDAERPVTPETLSYAEYYATRWGRRGLCPDQPLLRAERMPRKQLLPTSGLGGKLTKKKLSGAEGEDEAMAMLDEVHLVPELCLLCPVPCPLWEPLAALPRLMWHTEAAMQAAALRERITPAGLPTERSPSVALIRTALTAKSALEGADYERLETLGDGFIKYAVSVQLFAAHPTFHEGQLTKRKDRMVANRRLAELAQRLGLDRCVRLHPFSMAGWLDPQPHLRSDKVLADGLEALVGAFYVAGGEIAARAFLQHLGIIPPWKTMTATEMAKEPGKGQGEENRPPGSGLESCTDFESLEETLRYKFRCRRLAEEALTHCSWPGSGSACYQRLEFLGDAVLDLAVTRYFFNSFREATPSKMHDMRSVTVNAERLALVVVRAGLHRHIRHQSPRLFQHIEQFVGQWNDEVTTGMEKLSGDHQAPVSLPPPPQLRPRLPATHVKQDALNHPHHHSPSAGALPLPGRPGERNGTPAHQQQQQQQWKQQSAATKSNGHADEVAQQARRELRERAEQEVMRTCAFGFEHVQAPKVLSDVLEALLGAIYIDSGGDLETVWRVVQGLLHPLVTPSTVPVQPVRHVQEMVQRYSILPEYEELGRDRDSGAVHVRVCAAGVVLGESFEAGNFRAACRLAAKDAVGRWPVVLRELETALAAQRAERKRKREKGIAFQAAIEAAQGEYRAEVLAEERGRETKQGREEGAEEGLAWKRRRREAQVGDSAGFGVEKGETGEISGGCQAEDEAGQGGSEGLGRTAAEAAAAVEGEEEEEVLRALPSLEYVV